MKAQSWFVAASLIAFAGAPLSANFAPTDEPGTAPATVVGVSEDAAPDPADPEATPPADPKQTTPAQTTPGRNRPKPGEKPKTDPNAPATTTPPGDPNAPATPANKPATKSRTPVAATPAEAAITTLPLSTDPGPYITRDKPKNWTFNVRVEVLATTYDDVVSNPGSGNGSVRMPAHDTWAFKTLSVVFPIIGRTASSDTIAGSWTGKLRVNDKVVDEKIETGDLIDNGHSGTRLVKFTAVDGTARAIDLDITYNLIAYRTTLDEPAAMKVKWPKGGWPADAASTFKPQMFIDYAPDPESGGDLAPYETETLQNLINSWLGAERVKSPKDIPPLRLAKIITGGVVKDIQPSGNGISYNRRGQLEGIDLKPIPLTIEERKGSEFDMVCVFVAAMRRVGLPTRLVMGYQKEEDGDDDKFLDKNKGTAKLRAWAEFALFDENFKTGANAEACMNWVPVDVVALRKSSSRPPPLDRTWRYFGTVEDLEGTAPFSFHMHPPTTVRAYGSPGFWGWWMTPQNPPRAEQNLMFNVTRTAVKGSDRDKEKLEKEQQGKGKQPQQKKKN